MVGIGDRVVPGHVNNRMIGTLVNGRLRPLGLSPISTIDLPPPGSLGHALGWREALGQKAVEHVAPAEALGLGLVICRLDKGCELRVGHGVRLNPERGERHSSNGPLAVSGEGGVVGAHEKSAPCKVDHVVG